MKGKKTEFNDLIEYRKPKLLFYSRYNCLREINKDLLFNKIIIKELNQFLKDKDVFEIDVNEFKHYFIVKHLEWDSSYFNHSIFKLETVLYNHTDKIVLRSAINALISKLREVGCEYCFIDIPSEDNLLIQALGSAGFCLVETRLYYYKKNLKDYEHLRYPVRKAVMEDIPNLKNVGRKMKNEFDRVHSDLFFNSGQADEYMATYAEACINGFADYVLVPNEPSTKGAAFFAANFNREDSKILGAGISQFVLAVVDAENSRGWYGKLLSEMSYMLKEQGADYIITNTQSTNRAVIHTYEKYGFEYGHTSHIFSLIL